MYTEHDHTYVVCAYGASPYLEECLNSVVNQSVHSRVIISTSTPSEGISSLAEKIGVPLMVNKGASGIAGDWNAALSHCDTPLVTLAHQDDVYLASYTESMLKAINSADKPLIYFSDYAELRDGNLVSSNKLLRIKRLLLAPLKVPFFASSRLVRRRCLSLGSPICCPSVTFVMKSLPRPIFEEGFKSDLDWQAWEKMAHLHGSFVYDPTVQMRHRIHQDSETSSLIMDDTRVREDLEMLSLFWPGSIARLINRFYSKAQLSNEI